MDGTSAATPYVSGVAALVWSHHPECNNAEIRNILHQTAKDLGTAGRDSNTGFGLIQAKDALDLIDLGGCDGIINNPPTLIGTPATNVNEDEFYQFAPTIADEDQDDILTISIINQPSWADFDEQTGELSGTPLNADVGIYNGLVITVTDDSDTSASTTPFSIEVINVNDAPVISTTPQTSVAQDSNYQYIIAADDDDLNTTLSYSAPVTPSWLTFDLNSKTLSGTPLNANIGSHSVELQVSDGEAIVNQNFTIEVTNVNDAPIIDGNPANSINENRSYLFVPTASDPDDDALTFSISGKPDWATFNNNTGQLSGSPSGNGTSFHNIVITVSDGELTADLPFTITVVASLYSDWENNGAPIEHTVWTPTAANQTADFTQSRGFKQNQTRTEQQQELSSGSSIINVGKLIVHDRVINDTANRTITVAPAAWTNVGGHDDCGIWSPAIGTVDFGTTFTQTRSCKQDQQRSWNYNADNGSIHSRIETTIINVNESQTATGSKQNWIATTSKFTAWTDDGDRHTFGSWGVAANAQTANFNQNRSYKQDQPRNEQPRERDTISGLFRNTGAIKVNNQTIDGSEPRSVVVSWSGWANSGGVHSCSSWSPATSSKNLGSAFTQSANCQQIQARQRIYQANNAEIKRVAEARNIAKTGTRSATGSLDYITGTAAGSWSGWSNVGSAYWFSDWSQSCSSFNIGTRFTRSRNYEQKRQRSRSVYNVWASGKANTFKETETASGNQTLSQSQTRDGCRDYVTGTTTEYTNWVYGAGYSYGSWDKSCTTHLKGTTFTRSRAYKQDKTRSATTYNLWASGNRTVRSGPVQSSITENKSQSDSEAGCRPDEIISMPADPWSGWSNTGAGYGHGGWDDSCQNHNLGTTFTRHRSYKQSQTRTRKVYNLWLYGKKELKTTETQSRTVNLTQTDSEAGCRDYIVNHDDKEYYWNYGAWSCANWTPSTYSVRRGIRFTQSRSCTREKDYWYKRYVVYYSGKRVLAATVKSSDGSESKTESRSAIGTRDFDECLIPNQQECR